MKLFKTVLALFYTAASLAQSPGRLSGTVLDFNTHEPLTGVSILIYESSGIVGGITNREGVFSLNDPGKMDSVKFSAIGYRSQLLKFPRQVQQENITVYLDQESENLEAVVVRPPDILEIIRKAIEKIEHTRNSKEFENLAFYREIIKDSQQYYSVSEAVFKTQFFPEKKSSKLKLIKGRSKEDVAYTRLFEDFHPGGGPQDAINLSFVFGQPDFLNKDRIKYFDYKKELVTRLDGHPVYIIGFEQKPGIREALESGRIFIDAENYDVLKFEAHNSRVGTPYIKSLKGTDKIFAGLLHIDFSIKGWSRTASYRETEGIELLDNASLDYIIDYRQLKKNINLHLDIQTQLMMTEFHPQINNAIQKDEEWERKDLMVNLPADFDSAFWGSNNILSPTEENMKMMGAISERNNEQGTVDSTLGWKYFKPDNFISNGNQDSLNIIALVKSNWEDKETGGMIYKNIDGDFNIEARLTISKRSNLREQPDNGFQQAGIIVRNSKNNAENNLILSMGTGGNDKPKSFIKKTSDNKTKSQVDKTGGMNGWLRVQRIGNRLDIYRRSNERDAWLQVDSYKPGWLNRPLQVGFSVMARFAGDAPKQHPDIRAVFSDIKFQY
jgi:hypothetical protein